MAVVFLQVTLALYVATTALYLTYVVTFREGLADAARRLLLGTFLIHFAANVEWMGDLGPQRLTHVYALLPLFAWLLAGAYLFLDWRFKLRVLGAFVTPILTVSLILCLMAHPEVRPVSQPVTGALLPVHISLAFMGVVALALACGVAILYLLLEYQLKHKRFGKIFHRFPSLETLDLVGYRCVTIGFPIYTIAIILGALWAEHLLGGAWEWHWFLAVAAWVFFGLLLQARLMAGWRGRRAAVLTIAGFCAVLGVVVEYMVRGSGAS